MLLFMHGHTHGHRQACKCTVTNTHTQPHTRTRTHTVTHIHSHTHTHTHMIQTTNRSKFVTVKQGLKGFTTSAVCRTLIMQDGEDFELGSGSEAAKMDKENRSLVWRQPDRSVLRHVKLARKFETDHFVEGRRYMITYHVLGNRKCQKAYH